MAVNFVVLLAAGILLLTTVVSAAKLSVPKILLPYWSLHASNFTIEVHDTVSCFSWRSSRPEVVTVTALGDDSSCSQSAVVTAVSKSSHRLTAIVLAENAGGFEALRCDVIVDAITVIEIETTTRELFLEDSPEKFVVRAQDGEGNTFSSLDGVPFEWSLLSDAPESREPRQDVLRILTFKDSSYDTPAHIALFEEQGLQGSSVLVEGTKTGSAKVQAKLKDPVYKKVPPTSVRLVVVANLILSPPDAYVVIFGQVPYKVELIRYGQVSEIAMPSPQYYMEVNDSSLCSMDMATSTATGLQLGQTSILLKDRNIQPPLLETYRLPAAVITVVTPSRLGFVILPDRRWVMEAGREYDILVELLDADGHKLFLSSNIRMAVTFVSQHIEVLSSSANGAVHHVRALRKASSHVEGRLTSVIQQDGSAYELRPTVSGQQTFDIYDPITVRPPVLVFPWYPEGAVFRHSLQAVGGSGEYLWSSTSSAIAVNSRGEIETRNEVATVTVIAKDVKNPAHTGMAQVMIIPPAEMTFGEGRVEAEIGTTLALQLKVFGFLGNEGHEFTDCAKMAVRVNIEGNAFRHIPVTQADGTATPLGEFVGNGSGCAVLNLRAENLGRTDVTVEYLVSGSGSDYAELRAHITVAAYKPLLPIDPERVTVVAAGSTRDLHFYGGPLPWVLDPSKYYDKATARDPSGRLQLKTLTHVSAATISASSVGKHVWRAECPGRGTGETTVEIAVGNEPTPSNKYPAVATASVKVSCSDPAGLLLVPEIDAARGPLPCPLSSGARSIEAPTPAQNYKHLNVSVIVTDSNGRKFDNVSSLQFMWDLSNVSLAQLDTGHDGSLYRLLTESAGGKTVAKDYVVLQPQRRVGTLTVSAKVLPSAISASIELMLVDDVRITPDHVSMFNHPSGNVEMHVSGGSGRFYVEPAGSGDAAAVVTYNEGSRLLVATPIHEGIYPIHLHDLCLSTSRPAQATVHVAGIASIDVKIRDKVEIKKQLEARVYVRDHEGHLLSSDYYQLMDLRPATSSVHISVVPSPGQRSAGDGSAVFIVTGTQLGTAQLVFSADLRDKQVVSSRPKDVQVFPPLRINPKTMTLIVGTVLQMTAIGGPQLQSQIEFHARGNDTKLAATVSSAGVLHAEAVGDVRVVARAVGTDPETGEAVIYSEDEATIRVARLAGVRIRCPLTRVLGGASLSLHATGLDGSGLTPLSFANTYPPLEFVWTVSNEEVAVLRSPFHASGISERLAGRFATQLLARREGHVAVRLEVRAATTNGKASSEPQLLSESGSVLRDEVQLQVFERLRLLSPDKPSAILLLSPGTELPVRTNRDGAGGSITYSLHNVSSPGILSISADGVLVSHGGIGTACLEVNVKEDFGLNQSVAIMIRIKPVSYIVINADSIFPRDTASMPNLLYIPLGASVRLSVSYHDDMGDTFDAASVHLQHRLNRFDQVQVMPGSRNGSFLISTSKVSQYDWGGTVLKVWDSNNPAIADYINFNVQYGIRGVNHSYTVGDIVCFGYSTDYKSGRWVSSSSQMMLDSISGIGVVVGPAGRVSITYSAGSSFATHGEVFVNDLTSLHVSIGSYKHVTLAKEDYLLPVFINGRSSLQCSAGELGNYTPTTFPFGCEVDWSDKSHGVDVSLLYSVSPGWQKDIGYFCRLQPRDIDQELRASESRVDSDLIIRVTSPAPSTRTAWPVTEAAMTVAFLPRFYVYTSELQLSPSQPVQDIVLSAVDRVAQLIQIRLLPAGSPLVVLGGLVREPSEPGTYKIAVQLSTARAPFHPTVVEDVTVELECHKTGDKHHVRLIIAGHGGTANKSAGIDQPANTFISRFPWLIPYYNTGLLLIVAVTALCIIYGCVVTFCPKSTWQSGSDTVLQQQPLPPPSASSPFLDRTASSPFSSRLSSPQKAARVALWSSGYQPQDASAGDLALFRTSPVRGSPKH